MKRCPKCGSEDIQLETVTKDFAGDWLDFYMCAVCEWSWTEELDGEKNE